MRLFEDAVRLVDQDRQEDYGNPQKLGQAIVKGWEIIFSFGFSYKTYCYAMMWLKMCREMTNHKEDNDRDLLGYLLMKVKEDEKNEQTLQRGVDTERDIS
jgi:hypothetical protein